MARVLVVEDDEDIRGALVDVLEDNGYQAVAVSDGHHALKLLATDAQPFDLILLDLMMPVMDGAAFRVEQLKNPEMASIPVIVLSARHDIDDQVANLKVAACLRKPIDLVTLLRTVTRVVKQIRQVVPPPAPV